MRIKNDFYERRIVKFVFTGTLEQLFNLKEIPKRSNMYVPTCNFIVNKFNSLK